MKETLSFEPVFAIPEILFVAALAVVWSIWLHRRHPVGASRRMPLLALLALRLIGIVAIVALLLNPVWIRTEVDGTRPPLLVLLDNSHSMAIRDVAGNSRFAAAKAASLDDTSLMNRLRARYDVRFFRVADSAVPEDAEALRSTVQPDGASTRLGESIASALGSAAGTPSGSILLISDGRNNGDANPLSAARQARSARFPVFTLTLGDARQAADLAVTSHRQQVYAVPDQRVTVGADLKSVGYGGQTATVDLLRDGKIVETRNVPLDDQKPADLSFSIQEKSEGTYRYSVAAHAMTGETITSNNTAPILVQVLKSKARVLVLEGRPSWDAKFLINALRTDPSIQVDTIFKLTDTKFFATIGSDGAAPSNTTLNVPKTAAELARYDVIIIGKGYEDLFDAAGADALKSFVSDHAGNLIFLRGNPEERASTLRTLEPLQWTNDQVKDVRMQVTEEGERNPAFSFSGVQDPQLVVQKLPTMISATRVEGEKALTVVLARAAEVAEPAQNKEMAVVAYQNYGQGKVLSLVGEGLWRWALLPPDLKDYGACYTDFWTQLVRWMVNQSDFLPGQEVSLKTDHSTYGISDTVNIMAFVRGKTQSDLPPVVITDPDGRTEQLPLGKASGMQADYVGTFRPKQAGEYLAALNRAHAGSVMTPFTVYPSREEDMITAADPGLMSEIARAGGGDALAVGDMQDLPDKLREAQRALSDRTAPRPAWDRAWLLAVLLTLLGLDWALRRRFGLL